MAKVGDIVRFLNDVGGGKIVRIENQYAFVEDEDGFEQPVLLKECVVVSTDKPAEQKATAAQAKTTSVEVTTSKTFVPEETPEGEQLNIVVGFEPIDIKQLSTTSFDAVLVNDSNYFLLVVYATRGEGHKWTTRYAGIVEPNYQITLDTLDCDTIPNLERFSIQYVAFKRDKEYTLKSPTAVEYPVDNTKFFRLHCFHDNPYFETPVIAFDIVKNDRPIRPMFIDADRLQEAMNEKRQPTQPQANRATSKPNQTQPDIIEVDLHINQLVDTVAGMTRFDMLQCQLKEFRRVMDENRGHRGQRIVFIHGKGEGVLRKAITDELKRRYPRCDYHDASFQEYGFGATMVTIK